MYNKSKLKEAEALFLSQYPGGFENPHIATIAKKHKLEAMHQFAIEKLKLAYFMDYDQFGGMLIDHIIGLVTKSSMVSVFEKPVFRDSVKSFSKQERLAFLKAIEALLYGNEACGFSELVDLLEVYKIAKWPVITAIRCYAYPNQDLVIKPSTVKMVIAYFEAEHIQYKSKPSFEFYNAYRQLVMQMASDLDASLSPSFPAFSGFLMMALEQAQQI